MIRTNTVAPVGWAGHAMRKEKNIQRVPSGNQPLSARTPCFWVADCNPKRRFRRRTPVSKLAYSHVSTDFIVPCQSRIIKGFGKHYTISHEISRGFHERISRGIRQRANDPYRQEKRVFPRGGRRPCLLRRMRAHTSPNPASRRPGRGRP